MVFVVLLLASLLATRIALVLRSWPLMAVAAAPSLPFVSSPTSLFGVVAIPCLQIAAAVALRWRVGAAGWLALLLAGLVVGLAGRSGTILMDWVPRLDPVRRPTHQVCGASMEAASLDAARTPSREVASMAADLSDVPSCWFAQSAPIAPRHPPETAALSNLPVPDTGARRMLRRRPSLACSGRPSCDNRQAPQPAASLERTMPDLPSGIVSFLFTDIEGSTKRWETQQQAMWAAVERHFALLDAAISAQGGVLFKTVGDAVQAAFPSVPAAVTAAAAAQRALAREAWGDLGPLRVRMAIHAGEATPRNGDYLAPCLNRLARVLSTGYGDQVLLTETARSLLADHLPPDHHLRDLGAHRLKDLLVAERIFQLTGPGLPAEFPPLKSLDRQPHNLPAQPTALIGRDAELGALREMLTAPGSGSPR